MNTEQWRPIPGFPDYEVSDRGQVRSNRRGRLMSLCTSTKGYRQVCLRADGKPYSRRVHALVAAAFIGLRPDGMEVRHLDGDKDNNHLSNLTYGTPHENAMDKVRHGTHHNAAKSGCIHGHGFTDANTGRRADGNRYCKACDRAKSARYQIRKAMRAAGIAA